MARHTSNVLGLAVLSLLAERPMHPYEMASTIRRRGKDAAIKVTYGSLYSVIRALTGAGFITPRETERRGGRPERTVYALTAAGGVEVHRWLRALLRAPVKEYRSFEATVALMTLLAPADVARLLTERVGLLDQAAIQLRYGLETVKKAGVPRLATIEREYALAMCEAERAWAAGLAKLIGKSVAFTRSWPPEHAIGRGEEARQRDRKRAADPAP